MAAQEVGMRLQNTLEAQKQKLASYAKGQKAGQGIGGVSESSRGPEINNSQLRLQRYRKTVTQSKNWQNTAEPVEDDGIKILQTWEEKAAADFKASFKFTDEAPKEKTLMNQFTDETWKNLNDPLAIGETVVQYAGMKVSKYLPSLEFFHELKVSQLAYLRNVENTALVELQELGGSVYNERGKVVSRRIILCFT